MRLRPGAGQLKEEEEEVAEEMWMKDELWERKMKSTKCKTLGT